MSTPGEVASHDRRHAGASPVLGEGMRSASERAFRFGEGAILTPANLVTIARLLLAIPTVVLIAEQGSSWLTVSLWFVLACTDRVDGWLARRDGTTRSGAYLDPLADKFLVIGGFAALGVRGEFAWAAVAIVAAREIGVSMYRSYAARRGISLPAQRWGKGKAFFQFLAVGAVLLPWTHGWETVHDALLWTAVALTLLSGLQILRAGWREQRRLGDASRD